MAKRPDMQVVGAKIAHLRREKGLCAAAFAREIEQPAWLIMLLESAHMEQSQRLIDLLPDSVIEELLQNIRVVYDVSYRWLTTRYQSPKHPPLPEGDVPPEPLMISVRLSPEDAMDLLDDMLKLTLLDPASTPDRDSFIRRNIKAISLLYLLQLSNLQMNGNDALASQQRKQFSLLLNQRIEYWEKNLNIADSKLNESTSA